MNGATTLDRANTIRRPNRTNTITIGTSQYLRSCRRNCQSSATTRPLLIASSKHPVVMLRITVACGVRRPPRPLVAASGEGIPSGETPDDADGNERDSEQDREEN